MTKVGSMVAVLAVALMLPLMVQAQDAPEGRQRGGDRADRARQWDPAQMRQRMMDRMKEQLGADDEEWTVLQPKVEKVMTAQAAARTGGAFGGRGGRGGAAAGGEEAEVSELARTTRELRTAVADDASSNRLIAERLEAYRAARDKANAELAEARKELKELVTPRQEAVLVMSGMLE